MKSAFIVWLFFQNALVVDDSFVKSDLSSCLSIYRDTVSRDINQIVQLYQAGEFALVGQQEVAFGPGPYFYYLHFELKNNSSHRLEFYAEIRNPHLNHVQLYSGTGSSYQPSVATGDYFPFEQREIDNRFFVFEADLEAGERKDFFLVTDKYNESIQIPISVRSKLSFIENSNYEASVLGYYFGAILIILLVSVCVSVINPRKLNLLFIIYLTSFLLFTFSHTGLGYQYLWSSTPLFNSLSRSLFALIANVATLLFVFHFFEMHQDRKTIRQVHWFVTTFVSIDWILHVLYYSLIYFNDRHQYWINYRWLQAGIFLFPLYLLGISLYKIFQKRETKYYFFLLSTLGMVTSMSTMMLGQVGIVKDHFILENITLIALVLDFTILAGILTTDLYYIKLNNQKLASSLDKAIADGAKNFLRGQQNERARLSQEIHDGTGVRLSTIQMKLSAMEAQDNEQRDKILSELSLVSKDLRKFSHNLSSIVLEKFGLVNALEELFLSLEEAHPNIQFHFDYTPTKKIDSLIEKELYFILCELINNSLKHSQGTQLRLKLESNETHLIAVYSDNGIGLSPEQSNHGIGLQNIHWRLKILDGKLEYMVEGGLSTFKLHIPF